MTRPGRGSVASSIALAVLFAMGVSRALATTTFLSAVLSGTQEVPPTPSSGTGSASLSYNDANQQLSVSVSAFSLQAAVTAVQINGPAGPGTNGPHIFSLPTSNPSSAVLPLTSAQASDLLAGRWYLNVRTTAFPDGEIRGQIGAALLESAVLPSSRSVVVGETATAFATVANAGPGQATGCGIALASPIPATLSFQTTNPATNTVTGTANALVDIAAGSSQSFVIAIAPTAAFSPTDVQFDFGCANAPSSPAVSGVNTLLLSASLAPVADVIAIVLPLNSFPPGVVTVDSANHQGAFSVAAINVGAADSLTATADTGTAALPLVIALCQTSPAGACVNPPGPSVALSMGTGAGVGIAVFLTASSQIARNPAVNRIFVRFKDSNGVIRGVSSIAVQASPPASAALGANLGGASVVPPTTSAASGSAFFTYDTLSGALSFALSVFGLQGTETAAHIHGPAGPGANGPIVFTLPLGSPVSGMLMLTPSQGAELLAGLWYVDVHTTAFPDGEVRGQITQAPLVSAVLPSSRSVLVGETATAFMTVANAGPGKATGCGIALASAIPATFSFQTTDAATNTVTGSPNTPVDLAAGASQSFVIAITPTAPFAPTEVQFTIGCADAPPPPTITGVNTLLLSASTTPVPDIIATAFTPGGVLSLTRTSAFSVGTINIGAPSTITVSADTGGAPLPTTITLCAVSPSGTCVNPPSPSLAVSMANGVGVGLAVFVSVSAGAGPIQGNAAVNRVFIRFTDPQGVTRGSTSVAIQFP
jgi:hypothetical protein